MNRSCSRRSTLLPAVAAFLVGGVAAGQGQAPLYPPTTPLAVDFKKAPLGSWAEYRVTVGGAAPATMKVRWAFLAREPAGNTVELTIEGPEASIARMGGKVVARMVLVPDPVGVSKPFKGIVMQVGDREPVQVPLDLPGMPAQKFQNPDPKKLVGKESIAVAAGSFATSRYRDHFEDSTVDSWLSESVPPLGLVKFHSTPRPAAAGPGGRPLAPVTMELVAHGKNARPAITRPARPFDAAAAR